MKTMRTSLLALLGASLLLVLVRSRVRADEPAKLPPVKLETVEPRQGTDPTEVERAPETFVWRRPGEPMAEDADADEDGEQSSTAAPGDPFGDVGPGALLAFRALLQARYASTFAQRSTSARESYRVREDYLAQQNDGFALRRVFLRVASDPSPHVGFKLLLDFAELFDGDPEDVLKQAYAVLRPIPRRLEILVGLFKRPFSVLELDASNRFEFANFGETNRLLSQLGYAGRDLGVQVVAAPLRKPKHLRVLLGTFSGHTRDEHDTPVGTLGARLESKPTKRFRIGAAILQHTRAVTYDRPFDTSSKDELPSPPNPLYPAQKRWGKGHAIGVDARYKRKRLMLRGELVYGDRVDIDERYGAKTFLSAWGLLAYRIDIRSVSILPALRYEWLDADRQHAVGAFQQYAFALNVLFWDRARFVLDATYVDVQPNSPLLNQPKPLQTAPYLALDNLRLTAQLQFDM